MRKLAVLGLVALSVFTVEAQAKPSQSTKYKFYTITGDSPVEIYSAMIRRGPDVNGVNAYASTSATSSQSGQLIAQGKSCRVNDYQFRIDFTINLPKLKNEGALNGALASKWGQFKGFLKAHEEQHKSIWLACARDLETKVRALRTSDCKTLDKKAAQMWKNMRTACDKKHAAFDAAEQKRLMRHPFVRMVMGQSVQSTKALKAN